MSLAWHRRRDDGIRRAQGVRGAYRIIADRRGRGTGQTYAIELDGRIVASGLAGVAAAEAEVERLENS